MNSKQKKILHDIFEKPTKLNILWSDIEKCMLSLGATIRQSNGSAVVFVFQNSILPFHKPHPQKEAQKYQIAHLRKFLQAKGVKL